MKKLKQCKFQNTNYVNNFRKPKFGLDEHGQAVKEDCETCEWRGKRGRKS